jgi:hypothetical protein
MGQTESLNSRMQLSPPGATLRHEPPASHYGESEPRTSLSWTGGRSESAGLGWEAAWIDLGGEG